jgi:hypothetical protein
MMTASEAPNTAAVPGSGAAARLRLIMLLVMIVILGLTAYFLFRVVRIEPKMLSILSAETEVVSHRVWNPAMSAFRVQGMSLVQADDGDRTCVEGLLTPPVGMTLSYIVNRPTADGGGLAVVGTAPAEGGAQPGWTGHLRAGNGTALAVPADFILVEDRRCSGPAPDRLPIWGAIEVGDEIAAATDAGEQQRLLLSGALSFYGRATTEIPILSSLISFEPVLYPVSDVKIPFGSRLLGGQADPNSPWRGIARYDPGGRLALEVSTEARDISIFAPGTSRVAETIVPSALAQLTSDPNLIAFQIYFAAAAFFAGMLSIMTGMSSLVSLPAERPAAPGGAAVPKDEPLSPTADGGAAPSGTST